MFDNPATFVTNGGHQYDEGEELKLMEPRTTIRSGRRRRIDRGAVASFPRPHGKSGTAELGPGLQVAFELLGAVRAVVGRLESTNLAWVVAHVER